MRDRSDNGRVVRGALLAATLSGAPSTAYALVKGRDPLEAALAAGAIVVGADASKRARLAAAVPVHLAISLAWTVVLDRTLPRRGRVLTGAAAGVAIAALDLGVIGRRIPAIAALPVGPQIADHIAFGAIAAPCAARRRAG